MFQVSKLINGEIQIQENSNEMKNGGENFKKQEKLRNIKEKI